MARSVALVDMDDTVVDYDSGMTRVALSLTNIHHDIPNMHGDLPIHLDNLRLRIWNDYRWWQELEPLMFGHKFVLGLENLGFEIVFVTKARIVCENAWSSKARWLAEHYPGKDLIVASGDKDLIFGDLFVDDNVDNMKRWLDRWHYGLGVLPINNRNKFYNYHPRVLALDQHNGSDVLSKVESITANKLGLIGF